jgi:TRAP-type transport system small permease protein
MKLDIIALADRLLRAAAALALAFAGVAMFVQVIARYVFDAPFSWAEELATLLFSWIIFLGAAAVQRTDSHLSVDTLRALLGPTGRTTLDIIRRLVIVVCSGVLLWEGIALSIRMWSLQYPAMEVTRSLLYMTVPVSAAFIILFAVRLLWTREPPAQEGEIAIAPGDGEHVKRQTP